MILNWLYGPNNKMIDEIDKKMSLKEIESAHHLLEIVNEHQVFVQEKNDRLSDFIRKNEFEKGKEYLAKESIRLITIFDKEYPEKLRRIEDAPYLLYVKGNFGKLNKLNTIAVVGSRKVSSYGKWATEKFVKELCQNDIGIVSGMAYGVDSIAHRTAIEKNGYTLAVLGSGIDVVYPAKNSNLYHEIAMKGSVISEFCPGTKALPYHFPYRNRIISGLSEGILIIEAGEKSGTLITANYGLEQGKEIFAVPGNIDSKFSIGTNQLIREGAKITMRVADILEELDLIQKPLVEECSKGDNELQNDIITYLKQGEKTILEIKTALNLKMSELLSELTLMEINGFVEQNNGKQFRLR